MTIDWSTKARQFTGQVTARRFSANELDTILYDLMAVVGAPVAFMVSAYAAYYILRSLLSPLFNGMDFTMMMPATTTAGGGGTGIPTLGRRRRKRSNIQVPSLVYMFLNDNV